METENQVIMGSATHKLFKNWEEHRFESSTVKTPEFKAFARDFKKAMAELIEPEWVPESCSVGHFEISGFVQHTVTKKLAYFSVSDVRFFYGEWYERVLLRTAKSNKDYSGGHNTYCRLLDIKNGLERLV